MFNNLKRVRYGILKDLAEKFALTRIIYSKFACSLLPAEGKSTTFEDLCKLETLRDVKGSNIYTKSVTLKRITYSYT